MIKRLAMAGLVSAAFGGALLAMPPAMAAQSASHSSTVSVTAVQQPAGFRDRDHRRNANININKNVNINENRDRRRHHHDWWDWD